MSYGVRHSSIHAVSALKWQNGCSFDSIFICARHTEVSTDYLLLTKSGRHLSTCIACSIQLLWKVKDSNQQCVCANHKHGHFFIDECINTLLPLWWSCKVHHQWALFVRVWYSLINDSAYVSVNSFQNKEQEATMCRFEEQLKKECDEYFGDIKSHILKVSEKWTLPHIP